MGRKEWATPEQRVYLSGLIEDFLTARTERLTKDFHDKTLDSFLKRWPIPEPTDKQVTAEGSVDKSSEENIAKWEKAKATLKDDQIEALRKRLLNWFHYKTRSATAGQGVRTLRIGPQKALQPWQAYKKLFYADDPEKNASLKEDYEKHQVFLTKNNKPPQAYLAWLSMRMTKELEGLTPADKQAVLQYQQQRMNVKHSKDIVEESERNRRYQDSIRRLPATVRGLLEAAEKDAGWHGIVILGGRNPGLGGTLTTIMQCTGKSAFTGKTFSEAMDTVWWNDMMSKIEAHFAEVSPLPMTSSRSPSVSLMNDPADAVETGSSNREDGASDEGSSRKKRKRGKAKQGATDEENSQDDGDFDFEAMDKDGEEDGDDDEEQDRYIPQSTGSYLSEYEKRRNENIASNEELLRKLGLKDIQLGRKKVATEVKRIEINQHAERRTTRSVSASAQSGTLEMSPTTDKEGTTDIVNSPDGAPADDTFQVADRGLLDDHNNPVIPLLSDTTDIPPSQPSDTTVTSPNDAIQVADGGLADDLHNPVNSSADGTVIPLLSDATDIPPSQPSDNTVNDAQHITFTVSGEDNPMNNSTIATPSDLGSLIERPQWVCEKTLKLIWEGIKGEDWEGIVHHWLKHELAVEVHTKLPHLLRPPAVSFWGKHHRNPAVTPPIPPDFGRTWRLWWRSLQPAWRTGNTDAEKQSPTVLLSCSDPPINARWDELDHAGPNGFFYILLTLVWWNQSGQDSDELAASIADVHWVLAQMVSRTPETRKRPAAADDDKQPNAKRRRQ